MSSSVHSMISNGDSVSEFDRQLAAGASPDVLQDLGMTGATPSVDALLPQSRTEPLPGEQLDLDYEAQVQAEEHELQLRAETLIKREEQLVIDLNTRKNQLQAVSRNVSKAVMLSGFQTTTQAKPKNRGLLNVRQKEARDRASVALGRACGVCALKDTCKLVGNVDRWTEVHPYQSHDGRLHGSKVPRTESRDKFLERLVADPSADCIPPKPKKP